MATSSSIATTSPIFLWSSSSVPSVMLSPIAGTGNRCVASARRSDLVGARRRMAIMMRLMKTLCGYIRSFADFRRLRDTAASEPPLSSIPLPFCLISD